MRWILKVVTINFLDCCLIHGESEHALVCDKVRDTKMMMNTVRNSIYYLLYVS